MADYFAAYIGLAGSLGTLLVTRLFDRRREARKDAREDQARLHDSRVEAYVDFLSAASGIFGPSDVWFTRAIIDGAPAPLEDALAATYLKYLTAHSQVILVASGRPVLEAVAEVDGAIRTLVTSPGIGMRATALDALSAARERFTREARADLGIAVMEAEVQARLSNRG
jgi:hypothetical protein